MVHNLHGVWRVEISIPKEIYMAKDAHNKAAEHHENAAKAHRMAAEHHGKGDHAAGKKHSATALEHSGKAPEAWKGAHEKPGQQKEPAARINLTVAIQDLATGVLLVVTDVPLLPSTQEGGSIFQST